MAQFACGEVDVLVATTVIEVGIDVPNATVMLVENAERFGISQLHQLRGRVGRGEHSSLCLLAGPPGSGRLRAAGRALRRLSPGRDRPAPAQGRRADRHPPVGARPVSRRDACRGDGDLLERARAQAKRIIASDPALSGPEHVLLGELADSACGGARRRGLRAAAAHEGDRRHAAAGAG